MCLKTLLRNSFNRPSIDELENFIKFTKTMDWDYHGLQGTVIRNMVRMRYLFTTIYQKFNCNIRYGKVLLLLIYHNIDKNYFEKFHLDKILRCLENTLTIHGNNHTHLFNENIKDEIFYAATDNFRRDSKTWHIKKATIFLIIYCTLKTIPNKLQESVFGKEKAGLPIHEVYWIYTSATIKKSF